MACKSERCLIAKGLYAGAPSRGPCYYYCNTVESMANDVVGSRVSWAKLGGTRGIPSPYSSLYRSAENNLGRNLGRPEDGRPYEVSCNLANGWSANSSSGGAPAQTKATCSIRSAVRIPFD